MKKYITLSASANGALLSVSEYQGVSYIVAPVISAVGNTVIFPANAPYPEFVPSEVLSLATESRNFRPVVMNHPWDEVKQEYCSANSPEVLEKYRFGFVFNSRFDDKDNRVKSEIWLDPVRAAEVGPEAVKVIERLQNGEIVEVSEGSYVIVDESPGVYNGDEYGGKWELCIPDHLAVLSEGVEGACSVNKHGCGANRVSSLNTVKTVQTVKDQQTFLYVNSLNQARTPKFTGTETSNWTTPTFSQYIKYLHPGSNGPKSVSQCSSELKREISSHSLLGDPEGKTLLELTLFPVVNPSNGKLNEKALRNVISGKGKPDDLSEVAYQSAIDTAKRLLNAEFGSSLEVSVTKKPKGLLSKLSGFLRDSISNNQLRNKLWDALKEVEKGLWYIEDYDHDLKTVVYSVKIVFGSEYEYYNGDKIEIHNYQRSYNVDANNNVTVNDDAIEVEFVAKYEPVKSDETQLEVSTVNVNVNNVDTVNSNSDKPDKPCSCKGEDKMTFNREQTVKKLIASKKFTESELKSTSDTVLKALEEALDKPAVNEPAEENKSADHGDKTIAENTPTDQKKDKENTVNPVNPASNNTNTDIVTLSKSQYEELLSMKPAADAFKVQQAKVKESLVKVLSSNQTEYTESELKQMDVSFLKRLANALKVPAVVETLPQGDYSFARSFEIKDDKNEAPPVLSVMQRIRDKKKSA